MNPEPLTPAWFQQARALVDPLPARPGLSCAVEFEAEDRRWHLQIRDGRVVRWDVGALAEAQITVRMPLATAVAVHRPHADGTAAVADCVLVEPDGSEGVASPLDVGHRPELDQLPSIPGADLTVQYHLADGPFGDVDIWWRFAEGRSEEIALGVTTEPDVEVWVPFRCVHQVRAGTMSILEALGDGGRVEGDEGPLMLYAGLEESPELQAVGRSCGPSAAVFGVLGEVRAEDAFQAALAVLAGDEG